MRGKNHTGRNISILVLLAAVIIVAVALSGSFSPPETSSQTFPVFFHTFDLSKAPNPERVTNSSQLVNGTTISVSGPRSFTSFLEKGISPQPEELPPGTYQITATKAGFQALPFTYVVGGNCERRDIEGICHVWVGMRAS